MKKIIFIVLLSFSFFANGHEDSDCDSPRRTSCNDPKTSYDRTYCVALLFMVSDKELNKVYQDLRSKIGKLNKKKLKKVQLKWIDHRDKECESKGTINVDCNHRVNKERIEYLRERIRECDIGSCNYTKIHEIAWE